MIWIAAIILGVYSLCILGVIIGMQRLKRFSSEEIAPQTRFSIIVPFRNEEQRLTPLISSLQLLKYPPSFFEVIFIDDASEDGSVTLLSEGLQHSAIDFRIIANQGHSNSPKKDAITTAISEAKYDWILTTDADCSVPVSWLECYDAYIQTHNLVFVSGPVLIKAKDSLIGNYQKTEVLCLQAFTMAGFERNKPFLCNGANLGFQKAAFRDVGGYEGNTHLASGDDIFLLEKMRKAFPKRVGFLKSRKAIVSTGVQALWSHVIKQRIRWASKTSSQKNGLGVLLGIIVLVVNFLFIILSIWTCFNFDFWPYLISFWMGKATIDAILVQRCACFFKTRVNPLYFLVNGLLYPFVTLIITFGSLNGKYAWKGREFSGQR